jgi:thymidylate synthase
MNNLDARYQALLEDILHWGVEKTDRTGTGTISVFGRQIRHKMSEGFPLLTTKKMAWKTMVTELLWFLRGDTNIKFLVDNGCHIWDGDAYKNYLKECKRLNIIKVDTPTFELNNENIVVQTYNNGFPELKENEILYKYSESRGYIGTRYTQEEFINKIKTDDEFAKESGELGPIYGRQWRSWNGKPEQITNYGGGDVNPYFCDCQELFEDGHSKVRKKNKGVDQITNLINELKTNPDSRRLMVNAWNVGELDQMVLPPCHYGFQVYTRKLGYNERCNLFIKKYGEFDIHPFSGKDVIMDGLIPTRAISLMWNQRSVDTFLGLPFNIASYGLLLEIIAKEVKMVPEDLIGNLGDVHLYSNHVEQAKEQILRTPYELPKVQITERNWYIHEVVKEHLGEKTFSEKILSYRPDCFELIDYQSHPKIKAPLSN